MSSRARVATAARVVVFTVAPLLLWLWLVKNPAYCASANYDLPMKAVALILLGISTAPLLTRIRRPPFRDGWTIPDALVVVAMIGFVLFIQSGQGRMVTYDGCGFAPGLGGPPAQ
jgi:hypothetical protein